jgi:hypothetical protein
MYKYLFLKVIAIYFKSRYKLRRKISDYLSRAQARAGGLFGPFLSAAREESLRAQVVAASSRPI